MRGLLVSVVLGFAACSSPDTEVSRATDAGAIDAGPLVDGASSEDASTGAPPDAGRPTRVLFIGNSYTAYNDLPGVLSRLGNFEVASHTPGGQTWEGHAADPAVAALIVKGWDYVVLQDQSDQAFFSDGTVKPALTWLDAVIKATGGKTVLYMTWAKHEDGVMLTDTGRFLQDVELVRYYELHAAAVGASIAPVGRAWERALRDHSVVLHQSDNSHPTNAGTYLAACVFYATLTGKSPVDLGDGGLGLDPALAKSLRETALQAILARVKTAPPLVGEWPLGSTPAGNDLVASDALVLGDATTATTFGPGKYAAVPYFPGIEVPRVTVSLYAEKTDWSATTSSTAEYLVGKYGAYEIYRDGTNLVATVHTQTQSLPPPITYAADGLTPGAHHIALTYDGATYALYVDKVQVGSGTSSGNLIYIPVAFYNGTLNGIALGGLPTNNGDTIYASDTAYAFDGKLSKLRIYDHALTVAEIQQE